MSMVQVHRAETTGVHGVQGALVGTSDTQTLTNKTISGGTSAPTTLTVTTTALSITDTADPTKILKFAASGITSGQTRTMTIPDGDATIASLARTETLTNKTLTAPVIATIVNTGTLTLPTSTDTLVGRATTDTLTNKTITAPVLSGSITGTYTIAGTPTFPATIVDTTSSQALTNKTISGLTVTTSTGTLTVPNSVTLTGPASSGTAATLGNTETITGVKTFGSAGAVGRLKIAGTTSGESVLNAPATGGGTLTLPSGTATIAKTTDIPAAASASTYVASTYIQASDQRAAPLSVGSLVLPYQGLAGAAATILTSGTAYAVYLGKAEVQYTIESILCYVTTGGAGTQTAEVGVYTGPNIPDGTTELLSRVTAVSVSGDLTTTGMITLASGLAESVTAGDHVYLVIRTAMSVTQPILSGVPGVPAWGFSTRLAAAGDLTALASGTFTPAAAALIDGPAMYALVGSL